MGKTDKLNHYTEAVGRFKNMGTVIDNTNDYI